MEHADPRLFGGKIPRSLPKPMEPKANEAGPVFYILCSGPHCSEVISYRAHLLDVRLPPKVTLKPIRRLSRH